MNIFLACKAGALVPSCLKRFPFERKLGCRLQPLKALISVSCSCKVSLHDPWTAVMIQSLGLKFLNSISKISLVKQEGHCQGLWKRKLGTVAPRKYSSFAGSWGIKRRKGKCFMKYNGSFQAYSVLDSAKQLLSSYIPQLRLQHHCEVSPVGAKCSSERLSGLS